MKNKTDILQLMNRIASGEASDEDVREYNRWCRSFQEKDQPVPYSEEVTTEMLDTIKGRVYHTAKMPRLRTMLKIAVAACVVFVLGIGAYVFINRPLTGRMAHTQPLQHDVAPGGNKAMLTLANGQTIMLDSVQIGELAGQGNSRITKADSGLLTYNSITAGHSTRTNIQYNTLSVPKGGQYRLILPDGSKVWLNAASSIHYPTVFTGRERKIEITGEVYLEVAEDADHPFIVQTRHSVITVLGTHFNVMAYENEPAVKTTLLEGLVKVSVLGNERAIIIKPGQQAAVANAEKDIQVDEVNAADVAAWTHGLLSLNDCTVQEFMNQLSRWYDVDIKYDGKVPEKRFGGMINRNAKLSDVLAALDAAGIHTMLEEKKIVVLSH
jgi:ferric-dicitrate binding protein FerR (iron transport regulator)